MTTELERAIVEATASRWTEDQARLWYQDQPWPCGFNYLPSYAVNFVDLWHQDTFDLKRIDEELGWAHQIGYNSLRVNIQYVLWLADRDAMMRRVTQFLEVAERHQISVMPCLFDDCEFSGVAATAERQPDPVEGKHNSRALASPGRDRVLDHSQWPSFRDYVIDVVTTFRDDPRILCWDVYNEPGNRAIFETDVTEGRFSRDLLDSAYELCVHAFNWVRSANPTQPLTCAAWQIGHAWEDPDAIGAAYQNREDQFALAASDIVSFHAYCATPWFQDILAQLITLDRPVLCTEWLARPAGSTVSEQLPLLHQSKIGAYQWGFVNGRSQTHIPWPSLKAHLAKGDPAAAGRWFHDVLRADGTPYDADEIKLFSELTGTS